MMDMLKTTLRLFVLIAISLACNQVNETPVAITEQPSYSLIRTGIFELEPPGEPSFGWLVWSPDSQFLALAYNRWWMGKFSQPSLFQIQVADIDSRSISLLQESVQYYYYPITWLPNNQIAYYSNKSPEGIWLMQVETKKEEFLMPVGGGAIWTRDGNQIAYEPANINTVDFTRTIVVRGHGFQKGDLTLVLNDDEGDELILLSWSPDGKQILFLWRQRVTLVSEMRVIDIESGTQYLISSNGYYSGASWSPDGKYIAYTYQEELGRDFRKELFLMNADGTCPTKMLDGEGFDISGAAWSPDGKWIAFTWNGGIYLLDVQEFIGADLAEFLQC